jgi:hypothetical protein
MSSDYLTGGVLGGQAANSASMMGWATLRDNHGNSTSGHSIACVGKPPITMNDADWRKLHQDIAPFALLAKPLFSAIVFPDQESPLQTMCRKLEAEKYHAARHEPVVRNK